LILATGRIRRKRLLLLAFTIYAIGSLTCSLAPTFAAFAAGRAVTGAAHAVFFAVLIAYVSRLAPPGLTGRALAMTSTGAAVGAVLGVPGMTALGNAFGWRAGFLGIAALMALVAVVNLFLLPDVGPSAPGQGTRSPVPASRRRTGGYGNLIGVAVVNTLVFAGHYTLYTYISVVLESAGVPVALVAPVLLGFGLATIVGIVAAAIHVDPRPRATALVVMSLLAVGTGTLGLAFPHLVGVLLSGTLWLATYGVVASLFQSSAVRAYPAAPDMAGAWLNTTSNIGIAAGARLGGIVLDAGGPRPTAWAAAAILALGALAVFIARGGFPRRTPARLAPS
jgi:predicted MFS family arabinose efflux permease